jgi:hypothetical protein
MENQRIKIQEEDSQTQSEQILIDELEINNSIAETVKENEKLKVEQILVILTSYSQKFQIKVILIYLLCSMLIGAHIFTFVYMFLTPEFYLPTDHTKSRITPTE